MNAEIEKIRGNSMGTTTIDMKLKGMRKFQDFIVYPISANDTDKVIKVQSDTRIGRIDLNTGKGNMSQSHSGGAYNHHLMMDKMSDFELTENDVQLLREAIYKTASSKAGNNGLIYCDNSGAELIK